MLHVSWPKTKDIEVNFILPKWPTSNNYHNLLLCLILARQVYIGCANVLKMQGMKKKVFRAARLYASSRYSGIVVSAISLAE